MTEAPAKQTRASVCPHDCPSTCALEVEVIDGARIGAVRGAAANSYTDGVICSKVSRYAERIHHPARLTVPLLRTGPKGSGQFRPIGWDEALDRVAERFATLAQNYDVVLSDVWGVIHNGIASFPEACDALTRFREKGGHVGLITNAPRPGTNVVKLLDRLAVPHHAYDAIVSSGDVTRSVMTARPGNAVFHIGPERDLPIFDELGQPQPRRRAEPVCSWGFPLPHSCGGKSDGRFAQAPSARFLGHAKTDAA